MGVSPSKLQRLGVGVVLDAVRAAADRARMGIALMFLDTDPPELTFLNDYPRRLLGFSQEQIDRIGLFGCVAPEEVAHVRDELERRRQGLPAPTSFETLALSGSGKRIPIEVTLSNIELDGRPATVSFLSDVSERWRALSALQESEERFRLVVEGAPDGVAILRNQRIAFLNPLGARLLGLPDTESGKGRLITEFMHPEDAERASSRIRRLLETGQKHRDPAEYRSRTADGRDVIVEISSIPIEIGGETAVLAFARDITERKAIQSRLAEAERLSSLGMLSAGVAHEINNPLAYVLLNLEYLRRELPKLADDPSRIGELMVRVRDAHHGAERVAVIVRDLKTFARSDDSTRVPVDLRDVMEAAVNLAGNTLKQKADLVREYRDPPLVEGNPNRLEQVFLNLLLNAAQAFPDDDRRSSDEIRIRLFAEDGVAVAEISDTGEGMPDGVVKRIFEPFFTTKPIGVGTGLGLPICRSIVDAHGGRIAVESRLGEGTTFRVSLPASQQRHSDARPIAGVRVNSDVAPKSRVVVIENEPKADAASGSSGSTPRS